MCIIWFIFSDMIHAQESILVDKWKEYIEDWADDSENEAQLEVLYADLSNLSEHPFDLNEVTGEQLARLPFLTDYQIAQFLRYRKQVDRLVSIYELKGITGWDYQTIQLVLPFVRVVEKGVEKRGITWKNLLKYGHNELLLRYDRCLQSKAGYGSFSDSILAKYPNRKYLGEPFYLSLRYAYQFDDRIQAGFVAEKDAGEPFWTDVHKGVDFYSFHFLLKEQRVLKTLALGDYKASFGQGLIVSQDFTPGRSALVAQAERRNNGFRRHYSTNEQDFFRGAAVTLAWKEMEASLFYSYRKEDAAIERDTFPSIQSSGLHRLRRDWEKRRALNVQAMGLNLRWAKPHFHVGITGLYYTFGGKVFYPQERLDNRFAFRGKSNFNIGVDYMWRNRWGKLYGETAMSRNGAMATLNALLLTPASYFSFLVLHRYYDRRYQALFGNAFAQNSSVENEQGIYLGLQWTPFGHWKVSAYADFYRFPWLKYQVNYPSTGKEYMVRLDYTPNEQLAAYVRYKRKEQDEVGNTERMRGQVSYVLKRAWYLRTAVDMSLVSGDKGWQVSQSAGWKPPRVPFRMDWHVAWFQTDSYATRIYSYEKNILYAFYMPSFYGKGVRAALTFRWDITRYLMFSGKIGHVWQMDRVTIGTDAEQIDGNQKTDLSLLVRYKF
ncbi:helix-hairpin-helix domain-containing protein [Parabacteroides sp. An277]|uniref:helix-hairpin-helix domain-containing protein n=1 Tax=Parabacteroides sp. An277 TaxID=1965619 RepID=UPI001EF4B081|nr:helix-hairpin-helix domain-containing protein [Parabacteroides sp. An277]